MLLKDLTARLQLGSVATKRQVVPLPSLPVSCSIQQTCRSGSKRLRSLVQRASTTDSSVQSTVPEADSADSPTNGATATEGFVDVLDLKTLRSELKPVDSPFTKDNNRGGGFVSDGDRIRLSVIDFADEDSAGALCGNNGLTTGFDEESCIILPEWSIRAGNAFWRFTLSAVTTHPACHSRHPAAACSLATFGACAGVRAVRPASHLFILQLHFRKGDRSSVTGLTGNFGIAHRTLLRPPGWMFHPCRPRQHPATSETKRQQQKTTPNMENCFAFAHEAHQRQSLLAVQVRGRTSTSTPSK